MSSSFVVVLVAALLGLGVDAQRGNAVSVDQTLQQLLVTYVPMIALDPPGFINFVKNDLEASAPSEIWDFADSLTKDDIKDLVSINQTELFASRTWPQLQSLLEAKAPAFARRLNSLVALEDAKFKSLDNNTKAEIFSTLLNLSQLLQQAEPSTSVARQLGQRLGLYFNNNPDAYDQVKNLWSLGSQ